ncbi:MAG TPA: hypothetical protein VF235_00750 [Actinomycetota bacterium]
MGYLLVFLIAAAVGVAVYALTVRGQLPTSATDRGTASGTTATPPPGDYVPVTGWRPDWQSRLTGLLGLLLAVLLGAAAIALASYLGGRFVVRLLGG